MADDSDVRKLLARFRTGDRRALSRLVSLVSRGEAVGPIRDSLGDRSSQARVIAFTGNSGVGKSSLIARLIDVIRRRSETVAVLACDPESAFTGGALLGDRVRMAAHAKDPGVWIRSLPSASGQQAVAHHLDLAAQLLGEFGFQHILIETVGAGQGDVAVEAMADVVVLLLQPEIGDELQWEKAGVLEAADVVVVHKGDLPGAEHTESQVRELLNLPGSRETPVVRVSSRTAAGMEELWTLIAEFVTHGHVDRRNVRALLRAAQERIADHFAENPEVVEGVVARWSSGQLGRTEASDRILLRLINRDALITVGETRDDAT